MRVVGSRHSFTGTGDSGELIALDGLPADVTVDRAAGTATVPTALTYAQVALALEPHGVALYSLASLRHISVGGSIATATHGSGDANDNLDPNLVRRTRRPRHPTGRENLDAQRGELTRITHDREHRRRSTAHAPRFSFEYPCPLRRPARRRQSRELCCQAQASVLRIVAEGARAALAERHGNMRSYMPPPFPVVRARLDRAIASRDLAGVRSAARDLPSVVTLADALEVLVLMLDADDPAYEAAAVRWIARFASECNGVTLGEKHAALEALDAFPAPHAHATLAALLKRHGRG